MEDKLLHLAHLTLRKRQTPGGPLWIFRDNIHHLDMLLQPIYQVSPKAASFEWQRTRGGESSISVSGFHTSCSITGPYDWADLIILEMTEVDWNAVCNLWQIPTSKSQNGTLTILEQRFLPSLQKTLLLLQSSFWRVAGQATNNWKLDDGPLSYQITWAAYHEPSVWHHTKMLGIVQ